MPLFLVLDALGVGCIDSASRLHPEMPLFLALDAKNALSTAFCIQEWPF